MKLLCQKCCSLYMHKSATLIISELMGNPDGHSPYKKHVSDPAPLPYNTCMLVVLYTI